MKKFLVMVLTIGFLAVSCGPTVEENVECKDSVAVQTVDTIQIASDSTAVDTVKSE